MSRGTADSIALNAAAQATLRVLIASYFLAVSLQIIPGTDLAVLFAPVLPSPYDAVFATGLVFLLSFMVMIGMATRAAALIIALMTFYASYLTMVELGVEQELGAFWRDIALIAALLLTYSEPQVGSRKRRRIMNRMVAPRRIDVTARISTTPRAARPAPAVNFASLQAEAAPIRSSADANRGVRLDTDAADENIFADDYVWG